MTPCSCGFATSAARRWQGRTDCATFLEEETRCDEAPDGLESPGADLWNGRGGGLLWILDGLDEVIDPEAARPSRAGSSGRC